ncbi:MAG: DUF4190 domain-containing protein [Clostridia bacterium]|nr:DUF4190 domain-containing protein [Clostridia bacterium]
MDNQNNQNFNGYQTTPDPTQQPYQQQPYQNPDPTQQPYQQQPYQNPDPMQQQYQQQPFQYNAQQAQYAQVPNDTSKTLGILSIVFSGVSLFCCGFIFGAVGIILGIVATTKNKKSPLGWIGIGIGVVSIILAIISMLTVGPQMTQALEEIMNQ